MMNKTKFLVFIAFSLFVTVLVTSFSSALVFTADLVNQPASVDASAGSFPVILNITYTGISSSIEVNLTNAAVQGTISSVTFSEANPITLNQNETKVITATIHFPAGQTASIGGVITADPSSGTTDTVAYSVPLTGGSTTSSFTLTKTQELTQTQNGKFKIKNTGTTALTDIVLTTSGDFSVQLDSSGPLDLAPGVEQTITVSSSDLDTLNFGNNIATITATPDGLAAKSVQFTVVGSFCTSGEQGNNLSITSVKIDNAGDGDENSWIYLDEVQIDVKVKNKGKEKVRDVTVELGLFDSEGSNQIDELDFENADAEQFNIGSLADGDSDTATFNFRVPADFESGNYKLAVKVYSDDVGESEECTDKSNDLSNDIYQTISVDTQDEKGKFIAFENTVISPSEATCGDTLTLTTDVYNIGDDDEDQVKVNLKNTEMKLTDNFEITGGLDQGDKKTVTFEFVVPQGLQTKTYNLELSADYDYRSGSYRESSSESTKIPVKVLGCTPSTGGTGGTGTGSAAAITASLESEAVAGKQLVVKSTITNLQSQTGTFVVDASGYDSWATLSDISSRIVQVGAGQSKQVTFTFDVNSDVEGEESFTVEINPGNNAQLITKEVAVNIAAPAKTTPSFNFGENSYLWIIGIVNVVLIVLIIVVAVRISKR
jgi:uncharacterized membrane protein